MMLQFVGPEAELEPGERHESRLQRKATGTAGIVPGSELSVVQPSESESLTLCCYLFKQYALSICLRGRSLLRFPHLTVNHVH